MRLNEVRYGDGVPVDAYGPGFFRVGGDKLEGPVAVLPSGIAAWGGFGDADTLVAAADDLDVLLIGTGAETEHIPADLRAALEAAGIGVDILSSPQACRTYNVLLGEGRRVGLAALPV